MSVFDMTFFAENKREVADIKREFRNSLNEDLNALSIGSHDVDSKGFISSTYHINTTDIDDSRNDNVKVSSRLILRDTFVLRVDTKNPDETNVHFRLFMNNDVREQIIKALQDVDVSDSWK